MRGALTDPSTICWPDSLRNLDDRYAGGEITKAQEQFSARLVEARLLAMASGWEIGSGPLALIARVPAERHIIGITAFGLALRTRGWRVVSLGQAVKPHVVADAARSLSPDVVAVSIGDARPVGPDRAALRSLARTVPLAIGGPAASRRLVTALGAELLGGEVVSAAADLATRHGAGSLARPVTVAG
jgi:MerR family transcriptional regulator, light-induced transcriptional regulator